LVPPTESDKHEYDGLHQEIVIDENDNSPIFVKNKHEVNHDHSEHEEFLHPNMIQETEALSMIRKSPLSKS